MCREDKGHHDPLPKGRSTFERWAEEKESITETEREREVGGKLGQVNAMHSNREENFKFKCFL